MSQNKREPIICRDYEIESKISNSGSEGKRFSFLGRRKISLLLVGMLLISTLAGMMISTELLNAPAKVSYTSHAAFSIIGDADMASKAASESWGGSGTALDPYLINGSAGQGYEIDATGFSDGIFIENTRAHFRISGALIYGADISGIHLSNAMNGTVIGSSVSSNQDGIWVENGSSQISLLTVTCFLNPRDGIFIDTANNVTIADSTCNNNGWDGVFATSVRDIRVGNTTCQSSANDGIYMGYGGRVILDNATCSSNGNNGISIYDSFGFTVKSNTCNLNNVFGLGGNGIYADWTYYSTISNNTCGSNIDGMHFANSEGIYFSSDNCSNNSAEGMYFDSCVDITVTDSLCSDQSADSGIWASHTNSITVANNTLMNNQQGIFINDFSGCMVADNYVFKPSTLSPNGIFVGIFYDLTPSANARISNNTVNGYQYGINVQGLVNGSVLDNKVLNSYYGITAYNSSNLLFSDDDSSHNSQDGLYINQCHDFWIRNCTVTDNSGNAGLDIGTPVNALIENNTCDRNYFGINLFGGSGSITIRNNSFSNNTAAVDSAGMRLLNNGALAVHNNLCNDNSNCGIWIYSSITQNLTDNTCDNNNWGIYLDSDTNCYLAGNTMDYDGIFLAGSVPTFWDSHTIGTTNLVNGRPVYYMNAGDYGTSSVPAGAGQVLVASSSNLVVFTQNLTRASVGLEIGFSTNIIVLGNTIYSNIEGVYGFSSNTFIAGNDIEYCSDNGIYLLGSTASTVNGNTLYQNDLGIAMDSGIFNTVSGNTCVNNAVGLYIHAEHYDEVKENTCLSNSDAGIRVRASDNSTVHNNTCVGSTSSWGYGIMSEFGFDIQYYGNNLSGNRIGAMLSDSNHNSFQYNLFSNNSGYGMWIDVGTSFKSRTNMINNNTFLYNNGATDTYSSGHVQAYDDGAGNYWNTVGTPHGFGNYWSDWTTPDVNSDGIVDVNYTLDGSAGAISYWPLTQKHWVPIPEGDLLVLVALMGAVFLVAARRNQRKDL